MSYKSGLKRSVCIWLSLAMVGFGSIQAAGAEVIARRNMTGAVVTPGGGTSVGTVAETAVTDELRGIWISYLDWEKLPVEQGAYQAAVEQMLNRCVELKMNAVFVHVRPDGDAMYPSAYFPWSKFVTGIQGHDPGYDPLKYFIEASHTRGLEFHAWINPFRVTGYLNQWGDVCAASPARKWLADGDPANDRWVLVQNGNYYFNPAIPEVRELIISGVREVVAGYDVDAIHFDDYFYPDIDNSDPGGWFDKPEYDAAGVSMTITQWRRENINRLLRGVYQAVKEIKPEVQFGVSPEGYTVNLRSDRRLFVDIDTWMSQDGYMDYIIPQIYWGFEHKTSDGNLAPFAFENNLKIWTALKKRGNVKLHLGLAMYKAGSDAKDNNEISEWLRHDDIIKRQVEMGRATGQVSGYCFYAYGSFQDEACQGDVANLMAVFQ